MRFVTLLDVLWSDDGEKESRLKTKRELVGYVPTEKRIAALLAAGLQTSMVRDMKFYDSTSEDVEGIELPPLPRHVPSDLAEVSTLAREYAARRAFIEERIRSSSAEHQAKPAGDSAAEKSSQTAQEASRTPPDGGNGGTPP